MIIPGYSAFKFQTLVNTFLRKSSGKKFGVAFFSQGVVADKKGIVSLMLMYLVSHVQFLSASVHFFILFLGKA